MDPVLRSFAMLLTVALGILSQMRADGDLEKLLALLVTLVLLVIVTFASRATKPKVGRIEKKLKVIVVDVRPDRRKEYREHLLAALTKFAPSQPLPESFGDVAVTVTASCSAEDVAAAVDACNLKIQLKSAEIELRYGSLEVSAGLQVTISGRATPGSVVEVDGLTQKINVDGTGVFSVQVPLALAKRHEALGYIPAICRKGTLSESIRIPLSN